MDSAVAFRPAQTPDVFTPTTKVRFWLDGHVTNPACHCCRRRDNVINLNSTTTAARTQALQDRLRMLHSRRRPLKQIDEHLAERRQKLREKAQKILNSSLEESRSMDADKSTSSRIKSLQHRLVAIQKRVSTVRKRDREFQERSLELRQKARRVLDVSMASLEDSLYEESPAKRPRLSDTFQRDIFTRRPTRKCKSGRQRKPRVVVPGKTRALATQTSACLLGSASLSSAAFGTFLVDGQRCSVC